MSKGGNYEDRTLRTGFFSGFGRNLLWCFDRRGRFLFRFIIAAG